MAKSQMIMQSHSLFWVREVPDRVEVGHLDMLEVHPNNQLLKEVDTLEVPVEDVLDNLLRTNVGEILLKKKFIS